MFTALFWKKTWSWIKHHWYFPVIIALVIIFSVSKGDSTKKLFDLMQEEDPEELAKEIAKLLEAEHVETP